jgi:hypothetical protein
MQIGIYCTVLAVLVGFTDYTTQLVTLVLYPTALVGITIIPLHSILTHWCLGLGRFRDVLWSRRLAANWLTSRRLVTCWLFAALRVCSWLDYYLSSTDWGSSQSQSRLATGGESVSKSWCRAPSGAHDQIFISVWQLRSCFSWGALSDERTGLSFVHAAGPCQSSLSRVRVPWGSRPYFTVSDVRLPFSSPSTTRRVTVEVLDPASTRVWRPAEIYVLKRT